MRADMVPGARFPDYELPDHTGTARRLSELQGADPLVLVIARGGYCPKEHLQHMWMAGMEPELTVGYCRIVTISTDTVLASKEWRQRLGAHWPFLADEKRLVQQDLDIREYTDPEHDPMVPHTILLEPGLVVYKIYMGCWLGPPHARGDPAGFSQLDAAVPPGLGSLRARTQTSMGKR